MMSFIILCATIFLGFLAWKVFFQLRLERRVHPATHRIVRRLALRDEWPKICVACGLHQKNPDGEVISPALRRISGSPWGAALEIVGLRGQGLSDFQARSEALAAALGVPSLTISSASPGVYTIDLMVVDPLADPVKITAPLEISSGLDSLPLGRDVHGQEHHLSIKNQAGMVVGGIPGSGKSAFLTGLAASLASHSAVQFAVFDGKLSDWSFFADRAWIHCATDDLVAVRDNLQKIHDLLRQRLRSIRDLRLSTNSWDAPFTPFWPLVVTVIDETQIFLDVSSMSKDDRPIATEIVKIVSTLIRQGRSAGFFTILATQKPTSDSIPTAIRDSCGLALSFAVQTPEAAQAVLGAAVRASEMSPVGLQLPQHQGVAVVWSQTFFGFHRVRAPFLDPQVLPDVIRSTAHLKADPVVGLWLLAEFLLDESPRERV